MITDITITDRSVQVTHDAWTERAAGGGTITGPRTVHYVRADVERLAEMAGWHGVPLDADVPAMGTTMPLLAVLEPGLRPLRVGKALR